MFQKTFTNTSIPDNIVATAVFAQQVSLCLTRKLNKKHTVF